MKQRDLLFAGLLLLAAPAMAQNYKPGDPADPNRDTSKDPEVIFEQGFEQSWNEWQNDSIDVIDKIEYYEYSPALNSNGNTQYADGDIYKKENQEKWTSKPIYVRTDSTFKITRGGVMNSDVADELKPGGKYALDKSDIVANTDATRASYFSSFGEDGGSRVFEFRSDSARSSNYTGYGDKYRRNLFVRLYPNTITDETPYRISFFVKADTVPGKGAKARVGTDLMRGYFHSEKPFVMGLRNQANEYQYKAEFEWSDDLKPGQWTKITHMSYYLNDSIEEWYMRGQYYWPSDWTWTKKSKTPVPTDDSLIYVKQPDKFFVRMSFMGDNSIYQFDNLTLTRSWIAGALYHGDILRIDFGFKNNIKDLCKKAKKATGVEAVEVPFDVNTYNFEVWGKNKTSKEWEEIYMRSVEYHKDGYMYMFTDYEEVNGQEVFYNFDNYEQVLVSFKNPKDESRQLKYTGDGSSAAEGFPKALDVEWIKAGKVIPDLINEIGSPVPADMFKGVYSMKNLPPVMVKAPWDDESFGLDPVTEIKINFSRKVWVDDTFKGENTDRLVAYVNDVAWIPSIDATYDSIVVLTKPNNVPALSGDVEIKLIQLQGASENNATAVTAPTDDPVILHYNFSPINRNIEAAINKKAFELNGEHTSVPLGCATFSGVSNSQWTGNYRVGNGVAWNEGNRMRMFIHESGDDEESAIKRGIEIRPHNGSAGGHLYIGVGDEYKISLKAGDYKLSFKGVGWSWNGQATKPADVYIFAYDPAFATGSVPPRVADEDKRKLGTYTPVINEDDGRLQNGSYVIPEAESISFDFTITNEQAGDYIFEFVNTAGAWSQGSFVGDFSLVDVNNPESFSDKYIIGLNNAASDADARLKAADSAVYKGAAYNDVVAKYNLYKKDGTWTSTVPSEWTKAKNIMNEATQALKLRMDTVNLVGTTGASVKEKLIAVAGDSAAYKQLPSYKALEAKKDTFSAYTYPDKDNAALTAFIARMNDAIKALDKRLEDNKQFAAAMDTAQKLIAAKEFEKFGNGQNNSSFTALKDIYDELKPGVYNPFTVEDDNIADALALVKKAVAAYNVDIYMVKDSAGLRRIYELQQMAEDLGSKIDTVANVKASLDTLKTDNDLLADVYKAVIKAAIYKKVAANEIKAGDTIDLSPFIKNYYLYTTPVIVSLPDIKQPGNRGDYNYNEAKHGEAQIADTHHSYSGEREIFIMLTNKDFTTLLPGWTIQSKSHNSGNDMVSTDVIGTTDGGNKPYPNFFAHKPVFDGAIYMDWGGDALLSTEVLGLPAGNYELGIEVRNLYKYEQKSSQGTSKITVSRSGGVKDTTIEFMTGYFDTATTKIIPNNTDPEKDFDTVAVENSDVNDTIIVQSMGKIAIADNDTLGISTQFRTANGNAVFDNFSLKFTPAAGIKYADYVAAAEAEITEALTIVKASKAIADNVEYYTTSGIKLAAPRKGEILLRKTSKANGKIVVDKVIIK